MNNKNYYVVLIETRIHSPSLEIYDEDRFNRVKSQYDSGIKAIKQFKVISGPVSYNQAINKRREYNKSITNINKNFSNRIKKCFSLIYHVRLTDRNDKSKSVSVDNLEAGSWQEAVDKVITDHPEFGLKPGDYDGSDTVEVHWNYDGDTLKSF